MPAQINQANISPQLIIKICGIRDEDNLRYAIQAGANAIGFMQVPSSPRYLTAEKARVLRHNITAYNSQNQNIDGTGVLAVAVVANPSAKELQQTIELVQPDLVQFHGSESEEFCLACGIPYIKVIQATNATEIRSAIAKYPSAAYILLDTPAQQTKLLGGSGQVFDWNEIPTELHNRLIIAGGLNPSNIVSLLQTIKPAGVDVSSGVEEAPGIKNQHLIKEFVAAALSTTDMMKKIEQP